MIFFILRLQLSKTAQLFGVKLFSWLSCVLSIVLEPKLFVFFSGQFWFKAKTGQRLSLHEKYNCFINAFRTVQFKWRCSINTGVANMCQGCHCHVDALSSYPLHLDWAKKFFLAALTALYMPILLSCWLNACSPKPCPFLVFSVEDGKIPTKKVKVRVKTSHLAVW